MMLLSATVSAAKLSLGPYVQDVGIDSFVVVVETDASASVTVEVGDSDKANIATLTSQGTWHEIRVAGLKAKSSYRYRVLVGGVDYGGGTVATAPLLTDDAPINFAVYGDSRDGRDIERAIVEKVIADGAELVLHTGDLVRQGDLDSEWRDFLKAEAPLMANIPLYPTLGNHEIYRDDEAKNFRHYFVLPDGGRKQLYYSFRYGPARFFVLDGNQTDDERYAHKKGVSSVQTQWLANALDAADQEGGVRHLFVLVHQPPFSTGGHCGSAELESDWVALFERHRVRAVFGGHDHAYQRLERNGIRYFDSGGGGSSIYRERPGCPAFDQAARRVYVKAFHYLRVRVAGDLVKVSAVAPDGSIIEEVEYDREARGGSSPELVDERIWPRALRIGAAVGLACLLLFLGARRLRRKVRKS